MKKILKEIEFRMLMGILAVATVFIITIIPKQKEA